MSNEMTDARALEMIDRHIDGRDFNSGLRQARAHIAARLRGESAQDEQQAVAWHIEHSDGLVALRKREAVDEHMVEQAAADGIVIRPLVFADRPQPAAVAGDAVARAREALAAQYEAERMPHAAAAIRKGETNREIRAALRALEAALSAAPAAPAPSFGVIDAVCGALTRLGVAVPESKEEQAARADDLIAELCRFATHATRMDPPIDQQRDMLARAIRDAAVKAGIARDDAPMTGPMLLMLCEDLANAAAAPACTCPKGHVPTFTLTDKACPEHGAAPAPVAGEAVAKLPAKWREDAAQLRVHADALADPRPGRREAETIERFASVLDAALAQDRAPRDGANVYAAGVGYSGKRAEFAVVDDLAQDRAAQAGAAGAGLSEEMVERAAIAIHDEARRNTFRGRWDMHFSDYQEQIRDQARAALTAALRTGGGES